MTKSNLVLCVRNVVSSGNGKEFGAEPGPSRFLDVPDRETPHPERHRISRTAFRDEVLKRASTGTVERKTALNKREAFTTGNVLVFVHGYNNKIEDIMERHNLLQAGLGNAGYKGAIVSFDWPSDDSTLNYLEDRRDAKTTAFRLVDDGIKLIAALQKERQKRKCDIDMHLLGHSTGAYVIREAFSDAEQHASISSGNWTVSQIAFIGADISAGSMSNDNSKSQALFRSRGTHHELLQPIRPGAQDIERQASGDRTASGARRPAGGRALEVRRRGLQHALAGPAGTGRGIHW